MQNRAAGLFLLATLVVPSVRAAAQGPGGPPPNYQQLVADVSALTARVASLESQVRKLHGANLTAADMVGTYSILSFQTEKGAGPGFTYSSAYVDAGTLVLNANGSASFTSAEHGSTLRTGCGIGCPRVEPFSNPTSGAFTWSFDPTTGTVHFANNTGFRAFRAGPGLAFAFTDANLGPTPGTGHEILQLIIRQPNP